MNDFLNESPSDEAEAARSDSNHDAIGDIVRVYLRDMRQLPLLTHEDEMTLARRIERANRTILKSVIVRRCSEVGALAERSRTPPACGHLQKRSSTETACAARADVRAPARRSLTGDPEASVYRDLSQSVNQ